MRRPHHNFFSAAVVALLLSGWLSAPPDLVLAQTGNAGDDKPRLVSPADKVRATARQGKAGRDTVLRAYSITDLLEYKDFYERERFRLEHERVALREKGIRDMEMFLTNHPKSKILDKVIIRLAELHYEKALEVHNREQEAYSSSLEAYAKGLLTAPPAEPQVDFTRSLELYQRLIDGFPQSKLLDDASYNKAFLLEDLAQRDSAVVLYEKFVQDFPNSRYVPDALFRVAEYYFNPPVSQMARAIEIYQRILQYNDSPKYDEALYRLGWSYYKMNDYAQAIAYFTLLADDVQRSQRLDPKNKITNPSLAEESIEYIGIAFLDYKGAAAAAEYLNNVGGRQYGFDILRKIGDVYMNVKEEYDKAIQAYRLLLKMYPFAPEAPIARARIAECFRALDEEQLAYVQRDSLFLEYRDGAAWWAQNTDEELRVKTHQLVERGLRENVNLLLKRADENKDPNLYAQAVLDSRKYLRPFAKDSAASQIHWNMALTLDAKLRQPDSAFVEYINCSNVYWNSRFRKMAAENAVALAQEMAGADTTQRPALLPLNLAAMKEVMHDTAGKNPALRLRRALQLERRPLTPGQMKLAAAIDNYIKLFPHEPETAERLAQAGALYYNNNDFAEAIKYFRTQLKHFPESPSVEYAEYLLLESYFGKIDYKSAELVAKRIRLNGSNKDYVRKAEQRLAESIFLQAESLADVAEHVKAAEEYRRVFDEVPKAEFADLALHNSGLEFDRAREYNRAVETYTILVGAFSQSPHYFPALNNMAYNYGALNDHRNAALTFERLAAEDPDSAKGETYLYNASGFYVKAEAWPRAIRVNRAFVSRFPASKDAADMFYEIANFHLKLDDFADANQVYGEYAEKFPESPRTVETFFRRGEYYEKSNELNQAKIEYEQALVKSNAFRVNKKDTNEFFAAEALFRLTEIQYREFAAIQFKLPMAQMELDKERKKNALLALVEQYTRVAGYGTLRLYEATYKIGAAYEAFAATWAQQEIPEVEANRRIVARKEVNQTAAELYERALLSYKHAARALTKLTAMYANQAAQIYAATDTTLFDRAGRIAREDTTLRAAQRWIERSKIKISAVIYAMAESNLASVDQLLAAPVPENMERVTVLEFRNQLLGKLVKPLVGEIVNAHERNLAEADSFALNNHWVEKSRHKIVATQNILAREYAALSWRAVSQYKLDMADYKMAVNAGEVRALELREAAANLIDFARAFAKASVEAYGVTFDRAATIDFNPEDLDKTQDVVFGFAYRFAAHLDSLAQAAKNERQVYDHLVKQRQSNGNANRPGEDLQEAVVAFEDNHYSLAAGMIEVLQLGFGLTQKHQFENAWSEKIILLLVKNEPEKYAGLLGLQVTQLNVPTDETWQARATHQAGWTDLQINPAAWQPVHQVGNGQSFTGYGANRLWLMVSDSAAIPRLAGIDSLLADSTQVAPPAKPSRLVYFHKNFTVAGLPVSGQIQLLADDSFNLFINGEYVAEFTNPANAKPAVQIKDLSNYLRAGDNAIAIEVRDTDNSGGVLEAVIFAKSLPGWEQREAELRARKERREELRIFERGVLPNIY